MNQLSSETTVDSRSFMVYVERVEEEVKGELVSLLTPPISPPPPPPARPRAAGEGLLRPL